MRILKDFIRDAISGDNACFGKPNGQYHARISVLGFIVCVGIACVIRWLS